MHRNVFDNFSTLGMALARAGWTYHRYNSKKDKLCWFWAHIVTGLNFIK